MNSETHFVIVIILGYLFAAAMWLIMGIVHVKWGTKNSFSGIFLSTLWLWYGYRNYDFFTTLGNSIDAKGIWYNCLAVLFLDVCCFYMAAPYFKHVSNFIRRVFVK